MKGDRDGASLGRPEHVSVCHLWLGIMHGLGQHTYECVQGRSSAKSHYLSSAHADVLCLTEGLAHIHLSVGRRDHLHLCDFPVDDLGWDVKLVNHAQRNGTSTWLHNNAGLQFQAACAVTNGDLWCKEYVQRNNAGIPASCSCHDRNRTIQGNAERPPGMYNMQRTGINALSHDASICRSTSLQEPDQEAMVHLRHADPSFIALLTQQ